ncbi:MAG: CHASE3 domain-containing protein [Chitinophagaceae bacterium]|nr:CHASE3 domain-containing protein [Chitinophagaceae bacterium]
MPLSKAKIRWSYLIALLLMLLSYGLIFFIIGKLNRETDWVTHSYTVIQKINSIQVDVAEAETGVRGYVLTNDFQFLRPYHAASKKSGGYLRPVKNINQR